MPSVAALLSALNLKKETGGWCARATPKTDDPEMKAFRAKDSPEKTAIIHGVFRPMVTVLFPSFRVIIYKKTTTEDWISPYLVGNRFNAGCLKGIYMAELRYK